MLILTKEDKRVRCLCGFPLYVDDIPIKPMTIRKIVEFGESKYNLSLMLIISLRTAFEMIAKDVDLSKLDEISDFELILVLSNIHPDFCNQISESLEYFLDYKIKFNKQNDSFDVYDGDDSIGQFTKDNYEQLISIIKIQNYHKEELDKADKKEEKPVDKKTAALLKQREEYREKLRKAKGQSTEQLTYTDYISILTAKSLEMNINKCLDMTVFAFFTYLERLAMIDSYDVGIQQLMAGAKPNQVNLKHWLSSL